jgi:putative DNA primase/helicase
VSDHPNASDDSAAAFRDAAFGSADFDYPADSDPYSERLARKKAVSTPLISSGAAFARAMGDVARELLGQPTEENSRELRFGSRGSMCVSLDKGTWFDNEAGKGGGVLALVMEKQRVDKAGAIAWLQERRYIEPAAVRSSFNVKESYDYIDADGVLIFQVCRLEPKDFRQRRPNPDQPGKWLWKMKGIDTVIYHLAEVVEAVAAGRTIYIAEGEKGVNALRTLGVTATCSPGGAGKWKRDHGAPLIGADVVVIPDNDIPGRNHADLVAMNLRSMHSQAARVRILTLPDLPEKGDPFDWVAAGGTTEQLADLTAEAPEATSPVVTKKPTSAVIDQEGNPLGLNGFDLTEDGIALAFTASFHDKLRYCHTTGAWFEWTGKAWRRDERKRAFSWSRRVCREIARNAGVQGSELSKLSKAATAASVEKFAQADETFAVTSAIWDRDPFLMGTPGGTLDLRTGTLRDPAPDDHITKLTAATPADAGECPLWLEFLKTSIGNDQELVRFLQVWCGYTLTGLTREHALLFVYGPGGNGKSVFLNTITKVMGEYATVAAMETFTSSGSDRHPTDLAMLKGARLVCASETEEGRAWAETRIKQLTGGDPISARFMRQDFFTFVPEFKLVVIGNHKPVLRNVDDAAKRRFNVVPFVLKPANPDRELEHKLQAEWPAIFRWMIAGCLEWQASGLTRPRVVVEATAEYFSEQDIVRQWVDENCELGPRQSETMTTLFKNWSDYAVANGEKPGTTKWFSQTVARLGCEAVKSTPGERGKRGFRGICVKTTKPRDLTEPQYDDGAPF